MTLQQILDNPDNNQLRLDYADQLDREGQTTHATIIRRQINGDKRPLQNIEDEFLTIQPKLFASTPEVAVVHHAGNFGVLVGFDKVFLWWERGFIIRIQAPADWFVQHAHSIFATHPVQWVKLTDKRPQPIGQQFAFRALPTQIKIDQVIFPTIEEAIQALNSACLQFGRTTN